MLTETLERVVASGGFVVGEYTTNVGPFAEDRFFVLISSKHGEQEWADSDPESVRMLELVEAQAGEDVRPMLGNATELASRVLFPFSLRGRDLYCFVPDKRGWFRDFWVRNVRRVLTPEVSDYLQRSRKPSRN